MMLLNTTRLISVLIPFCTCFLYDTFFGLSFWISATHFNLTTTSVMKVGLFSIQIAWDGWKSLRLLHSLAFCCCNELAYYWCEELRVIFFCDKNGKPDLQLSFILSFFILLTGITSSLHFSLSEVDMDWNPSLWFNTWWFRVPRVICKY